MLIVMVTARWLMTSTVSCLVFFVCMGGRKRRESRVNNGHLCVLAWIFLPISCLFSPFSTAQSHIARPCNSFSFSFSLLIDDKGKKAKGRGLLGNTLGRRSSAAKLRNKCLFVFFFFRPLPLFLTPPHRQGGGG